MIAEKDRSLVSGHVKPKQPLNATFMAHYAETPCNVNLAISLIGYLEEAVLRKVFAILPQRHSMLRFICDPTDGEMALQEQVPADLTLMLLDLSDLTEENRDREFQHCWEKDAVRFFEGDVAPLARFCLYRFSRWKHILLCSLHPAVADDKGIAHLLEDLVCLYSAVSNDSAIPSPKLHFFGSNPWSREACLTLDLQKDRRQLIPVDYQPLDHKPVATRLYRADLSLDLSTGISELANQANVPVARLFLAAVATVLARYSGQNRFQVGLRLETRQQEVLCLDLDLSDQPSFQNCLEELGQHLVKFARPIEPWGRVPQVVFCFRSGSRMITLPQLTISREEREVFPASLAITGVREGEQISFFFTYDPHLFKATTIKRLARHFETLFHGIIAFPNKSVQQLPMLTRQERLQLRESHANHVDGSDFCWLQQLFEKQTVIRPKALALVSGQKSWTFAVLNRRANQLARHLCCVGACPGDPVAVLLQPGPELILVTLAILKMGGVLLPLSLARGVRRLSHIIRKADSRVIITLAKVAPLLTVSSAKVLCLEQLDNHLTHYPSGKLGLKQADTKGALLRYPINGTHVLSNHRLLLELARRQSMAFGSGTGEQIVYLSRLESDSWPRDMFATWRSGGTVLLASRRGGSPPLLPVPHVPLALRSS